MVYVAGIGKAKCKACNGVGRVGPSLANGYSVSPGPCVDCGGLGYTVPSPQGHDWVERKGGGWYCVNCGDPWQEQPQFVRCRGGAGLD